MNKTYPTHRLNLRALVTEDAQAIYHYRAHKENFPFVDMPEYTSVQEAYTYIEKMNQGMHEGKWYVFAIEVQESLAIAGTLSIWNFDEAKSKAEFGYGLFPEYRGKGYMFESMVWAISFAFNELQLKRLEAWTQTNNKASIELLERLGFKWTQTVEEESMTGTLVPMAVMTMEQNPLSND